MELPKRKPTPLPDSDDSSPGSYFVTICTKDRRCILSDISVGARPWAPTVSDAVGALKRLVNRRLGYDIWQRSLFTRLDRYKAFPTFMKEYLQKEHIGVEHIVTDERK